MNAVDDIKDLSAAASEDFGAGRKPRTADELARMYRAQARYFESLAFQAELQLRANGIMPIYHLPGLTPAYLNEN